ncbi:MAG: 30S ribosomal protein S13 [Anaerolineae bacterium]|nr:30S ribosomal protein S13 [Anaerolineae bacterium]
MVRIAGVDLPRNKRIEVGLTYIYGIGRKTSVSVLDLAGVDSTKRDSELTESEVSSIREVIDRECLVEGDLRREVQMNIRRLIEIGSYRGLRHRRNLPVRGQRTKTNARTKRGAKRTVAGRGRRRGSKKK